MAFAGAALDDAGLNNGGSEDGDKQNMQDRSVVSASQRYDDGDRAVTS